MQRIFPVVTEEKFAKNNKLLTSYAANKAANLIKNGSFEANSSWKYLSGASYTADSSKAFAGNRSMKMSRTSKGSDQTLYQILTLPAGKYTSSAYVKAESLSDGKFGLSITDGVSALSGNSFCAIDTPSSDWQRLFTTVTLGESKTVRAGFVLEGAAIGTVYVDGAMFTKTDSPVSLNLLENSDMEQSGGWTAVSASSGDGYVKKRKRQPFRHLLSPFGRPKIRQKHLPRGDRQRQRKRHIYFKRIRQKASDFPKKPPTKTAIGCQTVRSLKST